MAWDRDKVLWEHWNRASFVTAALPSLTSLIPLAWHFKGQVTKERDEQKWRMTTHCFFLWEGQWKCTPEKPAANQDPNCLIRTLYVNKNPDIADMRKRRFHSSKPEFCQHVLCITESMASPFPTSSLPANGKDKKILSSKIVGRNCVDYKMLRKRKVLSKWQFSPLLCQL